MKLDLIKIYIISLTLFIGCLTLLMSCHRGKNAPSKMVDGRKSIGAQPAIEEEHLRQHIIKLAREIGPRNIENNDHYKKLDQAATYIEDIMKTIGYKPNVYTYNAIYNGQNFTVKNIEVVVEGSHPSDGYIVIGAHYDTVVSSPGADDNGSGIAVLLEMARYLYNKNLKTTIKLVAFPNEEAPYSLDQKTKKSFGPNMGSVVYAKQASANQDRILGMICLESIGYYSDEPGSQHYPWIFTPLKWLYGNKGNFLMALSNRAFKPFLNKFVECFKQNRDAFPMHAQSLPEIKLTRDIGRSDHKSFWQEGYPALMLTDTANFRNKGYHTSKDTADTLKYNALARVASDLCAAIEQLALQ